LSSRIFACDGKYVSSIRIWSGNSWSIQTVLRSRFLGREKVREN
jgi:hypothetical protein